MMFSVASPESRREFFRTSLRWAAVGGLGLLGYALGMGRRGIDGEKCVRRGVCRDCTRSRNCRLPAAMSMRAAQEKCGSSPVEEGKNHV